MKVSGEIQADGHAVTLTLVRVELGMLRGLDESMLQVLEDFGAHSGCSRGCGSREVFVHGQVRHGALQRRRLWRHGELPTRDVTT